MSLFTLSRDGKSITVKRRGNWRWNLYVWMPNPYDDWLMKVFSFDVLMRHRAWRLFFLLANGRWPGLMDHARAAKAKRRAA